MSDNDQQELERRLAARAAARLAGVADKKKTFHSHRPEEFLYDAQQKAYWCLGARELWEAEAVNKSIPEEFWRVVEGANGRERMIRPTDDMNLQNGLFVQSSTWMPGMPEVIDDAVAGKTGLQQKDGYRCYNTYQAPPQARPELADGAGRWVEHVKKLWPDETEHNYFFDYCAHMVQRPEEKCNAAIVVSGKQGIGKDAALYPLRFAVGEWNTRNIGPDMLMERFNPWAETLLLTVDEIRPAKDEHHSTSMYNILKTYITTPPDVMALNDKNAKVRYVVNRLRIFLTTNDHLAMYIPPEDRRLMVMHSRLRQKWHIDEGRPEYFTELFRWFNHGGGAAAIAGWLAARDISAFDPKGQVPKTDTFGETTERWRSDGDDELSQALDLLGEPECVLGSELTEQLFDGADELRRAMKSRSFVFRMAQAGYRAVPPPGGASAWTRIHDGFRVKTSKAYVKEALQITAQEALALVNERLEARAKAGPGGKVAKGLGRVKVAAGGGF